jgi:hypothetical protein
MPTKTIENELLDLETRYWQAIKDQDVDAALKLTDDSCIVAGAQGVASIDRMAMEHMMKSANYTLNAFEFDKGVHVHKVTDDVAVIAYKVHEDLTVEGKPVSLDAAESSTWVKRDGRWLCAVHTESLSGDPFGRDRQQAAKTH